MSDKKMKKIIIIILVISCVFGLFILIYLPGYTKHQEVKRYRSELLMKVEDFKTRNDVLRKELDLLQNDVFYLEKILRNEMGLVKPGEVIYKIVEEAESFESEK